MRRISHRLIACQEPENAEPGDEQKENANHDVPESSHGFISRWRLGFDGGLVLSVLANYTITYNARSGPQHSARGLIRVLYTGRVGESGGICLARVGLILIQHVASAVVDLFDLVGGRAHPSGDQVAGHELDAAEVVVGRCDRLDGVVNARGDCRGLVLLPLPYFVSFAPRGRFSLSSSSLPAAGCPLPSDP